MAAIKAGIGTDSLNDLLYEKMRMDGELETMKGERDE
jgi:hypothetical protein